MGSTSINGRSAVISVVIALSMLVPGFVLSEIGTVEAVEQTDFVKVIYDSPDQMAFIQDSGASIVSTRSWGAFVEVTEDQRNFISGHLQLNEIPDRTIINLLEQEITFDTNEGYEFPAEWTNPKTETYMVQFVTQAEQSWGDAVKDIAGPVMRDIDENLGVWKMTADEVDQVSDLPFVQWVGPYEPIFKCEGRLLSMTGDIQIEAFAYPGYEDQIEQDLRYAGSWSNVDSGYGSVVCMIDSAALPSIAKLESVQLVWFVPEMDLHNNKGSRYADTWDLWDNTISNLPQRLMGEGQIVHIQDTGLDITHWDFVRGPLGNRIVHYEQSTDSNGHGTATSGNAVGNGHCMELYLGLNANNQIYNELSSSNPAGKNDRAGYAGRAPEAGLVNYAGLVTTDWSGGYGFGARIFSNSWGPAFITPGYSGAGDTFMNSNTNAIVLFSQGNDGPAATTGSGNANGKLTVGVGAAENFRPNMFTDTADDPMTLADFSSRGPVNVGDLRIKPDIVETGTGGRTPASDDSPEYSGQYAAAYDPLNLISEQQANTGDYTLSFGGTSMSCPCAAGDTALIRDYLVDVAGNSNPHGNLMKNLLIHGADDTGYGYPSYAQGWGFANVRNSVAPEAPQVLQYWDNTFGSGTWTVTTVNVTDSDYPLKATMCHWDATGSGTLSTDYNLIVTDPSGNTYEGNAFNEAWSVANPIWGTTTAWPSWVRPTGGQYDWDTDNSGGDDINNVEVVRVENPEPGDWIIAVEHAGGATPRRVDVALTCVTDQALDVNANLMDPYRVHMALDTERVMPERDDLGEAVFTSTPGGSVVVPYWICNGGMNDDDYALSAPILPSGFSVSYLPASPMYIDSGNKSHGFARITVSGTVTAGTYVLQLAATSNNDGMAPTATSRAKFNIDVVDQELPPLMYPVDTPLHASEPAVVTWNGGNSIGVAYDVFTEYGQHVYYTRSDDGGATWNTPVFVRGAYHTGFLGMTRAVGGTYDGRLMLVYQEGNPAGYGGTTDDTRMYQIWTAWSSDNGNTWNNVQCFNNGEGTAVVAGANIPRCISVVYAAVDSTFHVIAEMAEYTGTNLNTATLVTYACCEKASSNGGVSWGSIQQLDANDGSQYYFFPYAYMDNDGGIALWYYHRNSGDGQQDRDGVFQYYDGSGPLSGWDVDVESWNTPDNLMFPCGVAANQGPGNNRNWATYARGPDTDDDRQLYAIYTDNEGGSFVGPVNGYGPIGPVFSDSNYGTRYLNSMEYTPTDDQVWVIFSRLPKYDPYGNQNIYCSADDNYATLPAGQTEFYATLDSFHKTHQRTASIGSDVYMVYDTKSRDGDTDVVLTKFSAGFMSAPDIVGPIVDYPTTDIVYCDAGTIVTCAGNINDLRTGGSNIAAAQYRHEFDATPRAMQPVDGTWNAMEEGAISTTLPINTGGWSEGWHWIEIRGQDTAGNWGDWYTTWVYTRFVDYEPWVMLTQPNGGEVLLGGGSYDIMWEMGDGLDADTDLTVDIYYGTDGGASYPNPIAVGLTGLTSPCTYNWNPVPLIDSTTVRVWINVTDTSGLYNNTESAGDFTIDSTAPTAATNVRAELDGTGVRIYWDPSVSTDIDHYEVWWAFNSFDPTGSGYASSINAGLNTDVLHANVGINNPNSYTYQVRTFDIAGHETWTTIQAAKYGSTQSTFANPTGWFLLGNALVQSGTSLAHVLQGQGIPINWDCVRTYDGMTDTWFTKVDGTPVNDLMDIYTDQAFWLHLTASSRFATAGYIEDKAIPMYEGWNLVAYPFAAKTMSTAAIDAELSANCPGYPGMAAGMLIADHNQPYHLVTPTGTENTGHNFGFWVYVPADTTWTVTNY